MGSTGSSVLSSWLSSTLKRVYFFAIWTTSSTAIWRRARSSLKKNWLGFNQPCHPVFLIQHSMKVLLFFLLLPREAFDERQEIRNMYALEETSTKSNRNYYCIYPEEDITLYSVWWEDWGREYTILLTLGIRCAFTRINSNWQLIYLLKWLAKMALIYTFPLLCVYSLRQCLLNNVIFDISYEYFHSNLLQLEVRYFPSPFIF